MATFKRDLSAIEYLQKNVYPDLHKALIQLIEHVVNTDEVRKHQEQLKQIKIFDKIEQKKVEKERLKAELGSEYESSENSIDLEEMGINQSDLDKYTSKVWVDIFQVAKKNSELVDDIPLQESEENITSTEIKKEAALNSLGEIREDAEDDEHADNIDLARVKQVMREKREQATYNPLTHLAKLIREVIKQ